MNRRTISLCNISNVSWFAQIGFKFNSCQVSRENFNVVKNTELYSIERTHLKHLCVLGGKSVPGRPQPGHRAMAKTTDDCKHRIEVLTLLAMSWKYEHMNMHRTLDTELMIANIELKFLYSLQCPEYIYEHA